MKKLLLILPLFLAVPLTSSFQDTEEAHEESPLEEQMLLIEDNLGILRRGLRDESKAAQCLEAVVAMQAATAKAKLLTPPMVTSLPEADQVAFATNFRKTMIALLTDQLALESAVLDGDFEAAKALFKKIHDQEESGHERFTEDE